MDLHATHSGIFNFYPFPSPTLLVTLRQQLEEGEVTDTTTRIHSEQPAKRPRAVGLSSLSPLFLVPTVPIRRRKQNASTASSASIDRSDWKELAGRRVEVEIKNEQELEDLRGPAAAGGAQ